MATPATVKSFPTPLISDVLFYEILDFSQKRYSDIEYGDQHYDQSRWPDHKVVSIEPIKGQGESTFAVHYAADREKQETYNFEHSLANLSGFKFSTVERRYLFKREEYSPASPKLGTEMANLPKGKFPDFDKYILISRRQQRISEMGRRAQTGVGAAELDSLYIAESRTYIKRAELVSSKFNDTVNGVLYQRVNIYVRGDVYDSEKGASIEDATTQDEYWKPTEDGQISSYDQVSTDVWVVVTKDIIPQDGRGNTVRSYRSMINYSWPAVLDSVSFMIWPLRDSEGTTSREYPQVKYKKQSYRGLCEAKITEVWTKSSPSISFTPLIATPIHYSCPFFSVNIPPCLHKKARISANIGNKDPKWKWNIGTDREFEATPHTDWPGEIVIDVNPTPYEGGYLTKTVTCLAPY
jgi:hypothetical protein